MRVAVLVLGLACCAAVVLDAFQTIILPRRPRGRFRITRMFYLFTWTPWAAAAGLIPNRRVRDEMYSVFGPLSLLLLLAVWASLLVTGFGLLYFSLGTPFHDPLDAGLHLGHLRTDLYVSGTTLFTLGLGDVTPQSQLSRILLVLESGTGLGFVALVIGYVPVLYQTFSRREVIIALLDGRAGSPPTATELLLRHDYDGGEAALKQLLMEWERWCAEVLESHVSYPILCYYRSQHDNQNWLSAMVCILDACALMMTVVEGEPVRQAQLTFAMARHALVDLRQIFGPSANRRLQEQEDRLPDEKFGRMCAALGETHLDLCASGQARQQLAAVRAMYEPDALLLCTYLRLTLPQWVAEAKKPDTWKTIAGIRGGQPHVHRFHEHVSEQAVTVNLEDLEHG